MTIETVFTLLACAAWPWARLSHTAPQRRSPTRALIQRLQEYRLPAEGSEHQPHFNAEGARFCPQRVPSARKALVYTSDKTWQEKCHPATLGFCEGFQYTCIAKAETQLPRPLRWT